MLFYQMVSFTNGLCQIPLVLPFVIAVDGVVTVFEGASTKRFPTVFFHCVAARRLRNMVGNLCAFGFITVPQMFRLLRFSGFLTLLIIV